MGYSWIIRYLDDQNQKNVQQAELKRGISAQLEQANEDRKLQRMILNEEAEELKKSWKKMEEQERLEWQNAAEQKKLLAKDLREFKQLREKELKNAWTQERFIPSQYISRIPFGRVFSDALLHSRELEEKYLQDCSAADKAADERARSMKQKLREEMAEYRQLLLHQACQGKEEQDLLDENVAREHQIICDREDAVRKAQSHARERLAKEVQIVRGSQIKEKDEGGTQLLPTEFAITCACRKHAMV